MNLFWVVLVTLGSVLAGSALCLYLLQETRESDSALWLTEHALCPVLRILVLMIVVSQVYPAIDPELGPLDFWRLLIDSQRFHDLINILFFGSLALAFLPLVSHPAFALPLQSLLAIALVFHWQHADIAERLTLMPSAPLLAKIVIYMVIVYLVTRELSIVIARAVDEHFAIDGSVRLVADALFVALQVPVMYSYSEFLRSQLVEVALGG